MPLVLTRRLPYSCAYPKSDAPPLPVLVSLFTNRVSRSPQVMDMQRTF
jgi:hypothetical protein